MTQPELRKPQVKKRLSAAPASGSVENQEPARERKVVILALLQHGPQTSINRQTVELIRKALQPLDPATKDSTTLDVWLESPGGDGDCAYKIGLMLRSVASHIRIVVPDYAKSAATLLSLVGDEIYMAPGAELGPLDAQIGYEQEGITISALDRTRSIDDLVTTAMDIAIGGGATVLQATQLSRSESLTAMLDFAAKFLQPVVAKLDPTMLHWSNTLLRVAVEYGRRLMLTRNDCPPELARTVPRQLMEDYPTHGYVISIDQAKELGLPVKPLAEYEFAEHAEKLYVSTYSKGLNLTDVIQLPPDSGSSVNATGEDEATDEIQDSDPTEPRNDGA
ncbi:SDH family Clp fold serine proteinase [Mycolicibacterium duvalii]|uniref:SDH family Clp fold serine proteinase n=1 Tax=Mycolicibacterium duvalii TaxID=39688 RepID=UPI0013D1DB0F|nr:hypothetical protein [Mycolicibacterium duvalii]MCV7368138.1 hypothetical protein [Mycolicibacterium duvalii]